LSSVIKCVYLHEKPKLIYDSVLHEVTATAAATALDVAVSPEEAEEVLREIGSEILEKAKYQADQMILKANLQSEEIKTQARQTAYAQGYEEGKKTGVEDGYAEVHKFIEDAASKAQTLILASKQEAETIVQSSAEKILDLVFAITEKVLAREIQQDPKSVLALIQAALQEIRDQDSITIMVAPDDYEIVLQEKKDLQTVIGGEKSLTIIPDNTLTKGSCFIETMSGKLDARIDTQVAILKNALQELVP